MDLSFALGIVPAFSFAAVTTAQIAVLSITLGLTVAFLVAAMRVSGIPLLAWPATAYVSLVRGTPALIQIFLLYFGGPQVGINLGPFAAGVIGLGLNIAAYMAEGIRGAVMAIDRGQTEAARAIGLSRSQTMWYVTLPQAARLMIRPLGVNAVALLKGTSLVATISVVELTFTSQRFIGSTYKTLEVFLVAAALYMVMVYALTRSIDWIDRRFAMQ